MALDKAKIGELVTKLKAWFKPAPKPVSTVEGGNRRLLPVFIVLAFVISVVTAVLGFTQTRKDAEFTKGVSDVQVFVQQMVRDVLLLNQGDQYAQSRIKAAESRVSQGINTMSQSFGGSSDALNKLGAAWDKLRAQATSMQQSASKAGLEGLATQGDGMLSISREIVDQHNQSSLAVRWLLAAFVAGLTALILIVLNGRKQADAERLRSERIEAANLENQEAVLNLLDEMGDLADGDLTVKAQVSENITGAIADSINYTIDSLRDLVTEINRATEQVNQATAQAQETSTSLLAAAEEQSKQITDTGEAVNNMTRSILEVSSNAGQAAQVAQRSLQAATQGAQAVQNTIAGMNEIRTQIQETSKRIKRLGESSQEISEIVELISDITEQTNILALNAAIQAASAGEAGRGFTVVAEEVQRLAERSSEATKQISAIVKTIQTDTNSAVAAMEKSTEGVVEGARLSDAAGQALNEIETVTNNLAQLIGAISTATVAQTEVAATVSRNMQQIQNITSQTTEGTKSTANSIGQLTGLAEELRGSVAGFKLS
ncbi:MAG: methyl-accepting chemotaxis protein [Betaproteobacteria bacterium HGW-Betaproteobacteria-1]|jgi:twitching motility protein PilJ|nr:MAG: methyl-accepting chemotaxis protein [Betaproteobacteria bacterium HGW-Betaproteobacteria-1]